MTPRWSLAALLSGAALLPAPRLPPVAPAPAAVSGRGAGIARAGSRRGSAGTGGGQPARGAGIARADSRCGSAGTGGGERAEAPASPAPTADAVQPAPAAVSGAVARFIGFVGPRVQHDPPFLGVPYTNFYCLRSFLDRQTGETAHQLYVADSYFGDKRGWRRPTMRPATRCPSPRSAATRSLATTAALTPRSSPRRSRRRPCRRAPTASR